MSKSEVRRKRIIHKDNHILECTRPDGECTHVGRPFIKMGGLICAKCRYVIKTPDTPEYKAFLKEMREKIEKSKDT